MDKRLWIIDAGYLFNAQRSIGQGFRLDYLQLRRQIEQQAGIPFWRAYYLNSTPNPPTDGQDGFHTWLRSAPPGGPQLITKLYKLKRIRADKAYCDDCDGQIELECPMGRGHRIGNLQQKGVDVGIATLALVHRDRYDTLVLSSGDGDLLDTVEFLSEHGKRVELAVFAEGVSTDLQARADHVYWINDFAEDVRRQSR